MRDAHHVLRRAMWQLERGQRQTQRQGPSKPLRSVSKLLRLFLSEGPRLLALRSFSFLTPLPVTPDGGWFHRCAAGLLACGSMWLPAFPVSQWRYWHPLSAYSRGGGCGIRSPVRIDPSTFPVSSPERFAFLSGNRAGLLCALLGGVVKDDSDRQ